MKQLESHSKQIGENVFFIRPLPAFSAANLTGDLAGMIIPIMAPIASLVTGNEGLLDIDLEESAPTIAGAFQSITGDNLEKLLRKLLIEGGNISVQTPESEKAIRLTEDIANEIFCEEVQDMFLLAFEIIRTNYNGFFKKLTALFGDRIPLMATVTK